MSVLQALDSYYGRMAARREAEAPGFSREKISFAIQLSPEGAVVRVRDLRTQSGRKLVPQLLEVPAAVKRTVGIVPNLLWDKTSYTLGATRIDETLSPEKQLKEEKRTADEHARFKVANLAFVGESNDEGLVAFRRFLETWTPDRLDGIEFATEMLDANVVFALERELAYLHEREAARHLLAARAGGANAGLTCLVTGIAAPAARLHPTVKGVEGAQSSGAALVSFNLDAFTSYGKAQGDNAPVSEVAAFRYGAALNRMLDRGSRNRLSRPVGDASVVFWADTSAAVDEAQAQAAEAAFAWLAEPPPDDDSERVKVGDALDLLMKGRPVEDVGLRVAPGTRFHVLGLSPNAARLSVRWWLSDDFDIFARRLAEHHADLHVEPQPWKRAPSLRYLLMKTTALKEKPENVPPMLAGEVMRAVLTGGAYPRMWLAAVIGRLRAGDDPSTGWHAAAIRAVLARQHRLAQEARPGFDPTRFDPTQEPPMSLNRDSTDPAYNCGRLFATLESAQRGALGKVNATIRDRYMGAASATPASIFPLLIKNAQSHLGKMRKEGKGGWIERELEDIQDKIAFEDDLGYPRTLKLEAQGRFFLGYYHQRKAQFTKAKEAGESNHEDETEAADHGE